MKLKLPTTPAEAIGRFRMLIHQHIPYQLYDCPTWNPEKLPAAKTPGNCSIATIWSLGLKIHQPLDTWLNSDGVIRDAVTFGGLFTRIPVARVGALPVFPWRQGRAGHIGMVTELAPNGLPARVIDCSPRNGRDDSVREHSPEVFLARSDMMYAWYTGFGEPEPTHPVNYQPPVAMRHRLGGIVARVAVAPEIHADFKGLTHMCLVGNALYFESDLDLDTDGKRTPGVAYESTHQDETAFGNDVNSDATPYIVLPGGGFASSFGIAPYDVCAVLYKDKIEFAVYADIGPRGKIGEGSIALHRGFGFERIKNNMIIDAGIESGVVTIVFPGSGDGTKQTPERIRAIGRKLFAALGGNLT